MFPCVAKDTTFFRLETEEHGDTDSDEEVSQPEVLCVFGREDMFHLIGREIKDGLLWRVIEGFVGLGAGVEDSEICECADAYTSVHSVSRFFAIILGSLLEVVLVSDLSMRHDIKLEFELISFALDGYILAETVVIHLFEDTNVSFVERCGGSCEGLPCVAPERRV